MYKKSKFIQLASLQSFYVELVLKFLFFFCFCLMEYQLLLGIHIYQPGKGMIWHKVNF